MSRHIEEAVKVNFNYFFSFVAHSPDEIFRYNENKTLSWNARTILVGLNNKKTSDSLRLSYLNEAVKLLDKHKPAEFGFNVNEFLCW